MSTLYRHASWDTPWWANPNRSAGRYNAVGDPPVQYWCTHPLGPAAEFLRWQGMLTPMELLEVSLRIWVASVPTEGLIEIRFDNAANFGIEPEELIGEDYAPTQELAARLRGQGATGLLVPSAALPGTEVVVLFGPRLLFPYLLEPVDSDQVPTAHVAESLIPAEVLPYVRVRGRRHEGLEYWKAEGSTLPFVDPAVPR